MKIKIFMTYNKLNEAFLILSLLYLNIIMCQELSLNGNIDANKNFYCTEFLTSSLLSKSIDTKLVKTEKMNASKIESRIIKVDKLVSGNKDSVIYFHSFIKIKGKLRYSNDQCYKDENKSSFMEIDNLIINNSKQMKPLKKFKDVMISNESDFAKKVISKINSENTYLLLEINIKYNKLFLHEEELIVKLDENVIFTQKINHSQEKYQLSKLMKIISTINSDHSNDFDYSDYLYKTLEIKELINLKSHFLDTNKVSLREFLDCKISVGIKNYNIENLNDLNNLLNIKDINEKFKNKLITFDINAYIR